ncbi:VOC family protein [Evansella clarkii]|uniref:VOC family protein n=1 Tax=Evansella clarkii TaxID=79879 RepID=UPI000998B259|nr:VOC family protein [Evansella clarkii]
MKNVKRIDTVFVPVTDTNRSEEWYMRMFNFKVGYRSQDGNYVGFRFDEAGPLQTGLTLYKVDKVPETSHIAFNFYTTDVDESYQYMKEQGAVVSDIHEEDGMRFYDFADPDGNMLGVVTFPEH